MIHNNHPVILFDGVCNLCNGAVQFIIKRDKKAVFRFAPLQSDFGQAQLQKSGLAFPTVETIVLVEDGTVYQRSDAALRISKHLSGAWPVLYSCRIVPRILRDAAYNWIARNRYRFFGRRDECMIPTPELKARFLGQ
jgi:predicted DCC family thiol-disulfide oxidoreductase YuxK